jgi:hypothetical protein
MVLPACERLTLVPDANVTTPVSMDELESAFMLMRLPLSGGWYVMFCS